jgi:hypothetical protein
MAFRSTRSASRTECTIFDGDDGYDGVSSQAENPVGSIYGQQKQKPRLAQAV